MFPKLASCVADFTLKCMTLSSSKIILSYSADHFDLLLPHFSCSCVVSGLSRGRIVTFDLGSSDTDRPDQAGDPGGKCFSVPCIVRDCSRPQTQSETISLFESLGASGSNLDNAGMPKPEHITLIIPISPTTFNQDPHQSPLNDSYLMLHCFVV